IDARDGGRYAVASAVARVGARGRFLQVDWPHRLVMTWRWDDDDPLPHTQEDLVEATLVARGEGTLVTVQHTIRSLKGLAGYSRGWDRALDRLAQLRGGRAAGVVYPDLGARPNVNSRSASEECTSRRL